MFKFLALFALAFTLNSQAFANDGSIMAVDVLGIVPADGIAKGGFQMYGKDTRRLANVLPETDVEGGRSVTFRSGLWVATIYCTPEYSRPTNGELRYDWMCTFELDARANSGIDNEDNDVSVADENTFRFFQGEQERSVLGIVPPSNFLGNLFSIYGDQLALFANALPGPLTFSSSRYEVQLACEQNYVRPTDGQSRNDYFCSFDVLAK